tara:strand:- start:559 stop:3282 length:2724 start_codon:yes stop_codon:yes gene_type:complete
MRYFKTAIVLLLPLLIADPHGRAHGQYLNREHYPLWANEGYENYAHFSYRDIRLRRFAGGFFLDEETRVYDPFGFTLLNGTDLYRTQEFRSISPFGGSLIFKDEDYRDLFQNLVVANDSYQDWGSSIIVGRAVEARFKPMMLSVNRMNGIRWDGNSQRNRFSILGSRISDPLRNFAASRPLDFAAHLFGGHWKTQIGSVLQFGASYVNTHITDTLLGRRQGSFRKGAFPTNLITPTEVFLAISDDSPEDGIGAQLQDVQMIVDGEPSPTPPEVRRVSGLLALGKEQRMIVERLRMEDVPHLRQRQSWLPRAIGFGSLFGERGGLFGNAEPVDLGGDPLPVDGDDVLLVRFEVPPGAERIVFRVLASNDYAIDMGAPIGRAGIAGSAWEDWRNVARAVGNVRNHSNLGWVEFDYGFPSGLELYGANIELDLFDFEVRGDLNISTHHLIFPTQAGRRHNSAKRAYSLTGKRLFSRFDLGWEFFRVPAGYRTSFTYFDEFVPALKEFELVDDNDDLDPWPDSWEHDDPLNLRFQDDITQAALEVKENLFPGSLRDVGFGVFPGLDDNGDGIFDTNVNNNILPDHEEPFLMYFVESEDFVYGDDFNNNGIVDSRENDNKPDYDYERDSQGRHLFVTFNPGPRLKLRLGGHDIEQIAGGGRNRALYLKMEYQQPLFNHIHLDLRHRSKRVQDDIPDPLYQYVSNPLLLGRYEIGLRHDPLDYRNSHAHLSFAKFSYTGIDKLTFNSTWRYELNHRLDDAFADGQVQSAGNDWSLALVNRGDYVWKPRPKLTVTPMLKWSWRRADSSLMEDTLVDETTLAPIVRLDFFFTERTTIKAGIQGFPFFKHRFRDGVAASNGFNAWHYIIGFQNSSSYTGYRISMNLGWRKSYIDFVNSSSTGTVATSEFFLQVRTN